MPVIITNDFPPASGGIQRVMSNIADGLASRGRRVIVVAPETINASEFDRAAGYEVMRYRVLRHKLLGMFAMLPTYLNALARSWREPTIASIWWPASVVVVLVPRWIRGPFFVFAHGSEIAPSRGGLRRIVMRYVYRKADAVIAISSFAKSLLEDAEVSGTIRRVSLAVDARHISPNRAARPTILSVGRLIRRKGFDRTIEAVAKLAPRFPELEYVIVGNGPQRQELEEIAARFGVSERVKFLGAISDLDLEAAYAAAWVFVLPTRRICDDVEGFGLVYLEAAMAELPSVAGRASGAVDAISDGETGLLVDGESVEDISDAVGQLLENYLLRTTMGLRALEAAQAFTWERTVSQVLEVIDQ